MKIGVIVNGAYYPHKDMVATMEEQYLMVRAARDGGWSTVISGMHYLLDGSQTMQQVPLLARLHAEAGEMALGLGIFFLNLHNPVYVAETVATMDIITRGNLIFGIGLGYRETELDAFQIRKGQRVKRFEEVLTVVKQLLSGEEVTFDSDYCRLDGVRMNLRPVQRPHPPIWMAANGDKAVARAARLADTWYVNPHATLQTNRRHMALFHEALKKEGRPLPREVPCRREIFCAKTRQTAMEMAAPFLAQKYEAYTLWGQDKVMPEDEKLDQPFEALQQDRFIIGSPEDCYEQLRPYWEELGVNHFIFRTQFLDMPIAHTLQSMRLISSELLPELRKVKVAAPGA